MPYEVILFNAIPAMSARDSSFLEGRNESQQLNQSGGRVSNLGEISNAPTQLGRSTAHKVVEILPFREDLDKVDDF